MLTLKDSLEREKEITYSFSLIPTSRINEQYKSRISDSLLSVIPSFLDGENFSNSSLVKYQEYMCSHDNFSMILDTTSISILERSCQRAPLQLTPETFRGSCRNNSWLFVYWICITCAEQPAEPRNLCEEISTAVNRHTARVEQQTL